MTSIGTESVASVPAAHLELLAQQLLKQNVSTEPVNGTEPSESVAMLPEQQSLVSQSHGQVPDFTVVNESNVLSPQLQTNRPAVETPGRRPPRLNPSKSAPAKEMEIMTQSTPSHDAFGHLTKAASFHAGVFPAGDTQPMASQVYREYTESMLYPALVTPVKATAGLLVSPGVGAEIGTGRTPRTMQEGETGYIDLMQFAPRSPRPTSPAQSSDGGFDELLRSQHTQVNSTMRDIAARTPALAGRKHGRDGEVLHSDGTSTKETPGFGRFMLPGDGPAVLSASQLFHQTQAPSSPYLDNLRSDPVLTRPSPNIDHVRAQSSPVLSMSSPVAAMNKPSRVVGEEPRLTYTSMRESQNKRKEQLGDEDSAQNGQEDADGFAAMKTYRADSRLRRGGLRRTRSAQVIPAETPYTNHTRDVVFSSTARPTAFVDLVTPAVDRHAVNEDADELLIELDQEALPEMEDAEEHATEDDPSEAENDVYDEYNQTVIRSQGNAEDEAGGSPMADQSHVDKARSTRDLLDTQIPEGDHAFAIADSQSEMQAEPHDDQAETTHRSSASSWVPGSQYEGRTSQDQALLKSTRHRANRSSQSARRHLDDKIPSSPPILIDSRSGGEQKRRQNLAAVEATDANNTRGSGHIDRTEIPESDAMEGVQHNDTIVEHVQPNTESNELQGVEAFMTARTHPSSANDSSSQPPTRLHRAVTLLQSQQSSKTEESPRKRAGVRHLDEIAEDITPSASLEADLDIDGIMDGIMTHEDHEVLAAVAESPRPTFNKRRRMRRTISSDPMTSPHVNAVMSPVQNDVPAQEDGNSSPARHASKDSAEAHDERLQSSRVLRDSPSKANALPLSTPLAVNGQETPESVARREKAGANAVSQLVSSMRVRKPSEKGKLLTYGRNVGKKVGIAGVKKDKSKKKTRVVDQQMMPTPEIEQEEATSENVAEIELPVADSAVRDTCEVGAHATTSGDSAQAQSHEAIAAPNRVWALFKDTNNRFYPATWLSTSADKSSHEIRFDDNTVTWIEAHHVRRLELRAGDTLKVDTPEMRKKTWTVVSLAQTQDQAGRVTDIHGNTLLSVRVKPSRAGKHDASSKGESSEQVSITFSDIYLNYSMWPLYEDRPFEPPVNDVVGHERFATPVIGLVTPAERTPSSRSRRGTAQHKPLPVRANSLREDSVAPAGTTSPRSLFGGMAFAISYVGKDAEKEKGELTRLIQRNGGRVLESGFEEVFDIPDLSSDTLPTSSNLTLTLKPEHATQGFVALIAGRHSRTAKYMQALALGLPTLSGHWILDSLNPSKNSPSPSSSPSIPLPWSRYLLSAGESSSLSGAVRSRTLSPFNLTDDAARLANMVAQRPILLDGAGVMIVVGNAASASKSGGKVAGWDRRRGYAFLTLALGAGRLRRVVGVDDAKRVLREEVGRWKWVYVDGAVEKVAEVLGGKVGEVGRKRKGKVERERSEEIGKGRMMIEVAVGGSGERIKVVNDEFVVQTLILGALAE